MVGFTNTPLAYLSLPLLDLTSLAAKRNCMAQTRRQERLRERVRAHMATVTWYTVTDSSAVRKFTPDSLSDCGFLPISDPSGMILSKKTKEPRAKSKETRERSPRDWIISFTPASVVRSIS